MSTTDTDRHPLTDTVDNVDSRRTAARRAAGLPATSWMRSKDDYGRSCHHLYVWGDRSRCVGAVVRLPAAVRTHHPDRFYLVNVWEVDSSAPGEVTYHRTLAAAKRHLEQNRKA